MLASKLLLVIGPPKLGIGDDVSRASRRCEWRAPEPVRTTCPRHPPGDTQAVFGGRKIRIVLDGLRGKSHHCRTLPARRQRGKPLLQLVEGALELHLLKKIMSEDGGDAGIRLLKHSRSSTSSSDRISPSGARSRRSAFCRARSIAGMIAIIEALEGKSSARARVWNRIPNDVGARIVDLALDCSEVSPHEYPGLPGERGGRRKMCGRSCVEEKLG